MICSEGHDAVLPKPELSKRVGKASHLRVHPANARVIKSDDIFTVLLQSGRPNVSPVPVRIQISRPRCIERTSHEIERFLLRIIRRVRIHQMQPQEKWLARNTAQPVASMVNDDIRRRKTPQLVERRYRLAIPVAGSIENTLRHKTNPRDQARGTPRRDAGSIGSRSGRFRSQSRVATGAASISRKSLKVPNPASYPKRGERYGFPARNAAVA